MIPSEKHATQRALIEASWKRCSKSGLDPLASPAETSSSRPIELNDLQRHLVETTSQEVLPYYEKIVANSQSAIILADDKGRVLSSWGDQRFLSNHGKALFQTGAVWQEQTGGTNAIGTALHTGQALQVLREEHYLKANRFMLGSAAPILAADRHLIGVLNVTSDSYLPQAHTLGMVKLMSQTIENRLIVVSHEHSAHILTFNTNLDNIDSPWSGLIAFNEDGRILAANRRAEMLAGSDLRGECVESVFGTPAVALFDNGRNGPRQMRVNNRQTIYATVRQPQPASAATPSRAGEGKPSPEEPITFARLTFGDPRIIRAIQQAQCIVEKDIPILVHGETGVGKEVFVRALHRQSSRKDQPFVAINCAAIPADLVESELFGYERGAFTGASSKGASGLIRKAHKGMLFLDEIGEMPLRAQARLLRVLQERTVTPLGSTENFPVDIKLVTATNCHLRTLVSEGGFRQDLFYRINGLSVELPPLRERTDKPALFAHLLELYNEADAQTALSDDILQLFEMHPWPGNIRQLINVLQVGLAIAGNAPLERWHLPEDFFDDLHQHSTASEQPGASPDSTTLEQTETLSWADQRSELMSLYQRHRGNVSRIARELSLSRNTIYKRLRAEGLRL